MRGYSAFLGTVALVAATSTALSVPALAHCGADHTAQANMSMIPKVKKAKVVANAAPMKPVAIAKVKPTVAAAPKQASTTVAAFFSFPIAAPLYKPSAQNGFLSPTYVATEEKQHVGTDLKAPGGTAVFAPVSGTVVWVSNSADPAKAAVIIQQTGSNTQYVLGHVQGTVAVSDAVISGQPVGSVMSWVNADGDNSHLHFGKNIAGKAVPAEENWGWGRVPEDATAAQIKEHGWVTPGF